MTKHDYCDGNWRRTIKNDETWDPRSMCDVPARSPKKCSCKSLWNFGLVLFRQRCKDCIWEEWLMNIRLYPLEFLQIFAWCKVQLTNWFWIHVYLIVCAAMSTVRSIALSCHLLQYYYLTCFCCTSCHQIVFVLVYEKASKFLMPYCNCSIDSWIHFTTTQLSKYFFTCSYMQSNL